MTFRQLPTLPLRRRNRTLAVAGVAVLIFAALLTGFWLAPHAVPAPAATTVHTPSRPPAARCRVSAPATAAGYSAALAQVAGPAWGAADLSASVPLPDGRSVWLFGDTLTGTDSEHLTGFVHSTAIVQDRGCFHISGHGTQLLPNGPGTAFSWLSAGIAIDDSHLLVATGQQQVTGTCGLCFRQVGLRGAILTVSPTGDVTFERWLPSWPSWDGRIVWGAGMTRAGNSVAMYGISATGLTRDLYVATASLSGAATGSGWRLGTTPIAHGVDAAGVSAYLDRTGWHVLTKRADSIIRLTSTAASGPFTEQTLTTVADQQPTHFLYAAQAHPEARLRNGGLLVTVCSNWDDHRRRSLSAYRPLDLSVPR